MYKWTVRTMVKRNIDRLNRGDLEPALAALHEDAELSFPGTNTWARQFREPVMGRDRFATHRGKGEIRAFLERYVAAGMQMVVEDVLVNGPPWNTRVAVRVRDWSSGGPGEPDRYSNRAVLFVTSRWGKILVQEDYEDTERSAMFDTLLARSDDARSQGTGTTDQL